MAKIVNDTELIFEKSDIKKDGWLRKDFCKKIPIKNITKVVLPDGLKKMPYGAFNEYESLKEISIPEGVTNISHGAFRCCRYLQKIHIPNSVTKIDYEAFFRCGSLKEINIPDGVTEIGCGAFENCYSLKSVDISDGVTKIGTRSFSGCESLKEIHIPDSVTSIGEHAFAYCGSIYYKGQDVTNFIRKHDAFDVVKSLSDNDLPLTDGMFDKAMEAKKEDRLRGFLVKTKKRLSEREMPDIDYSDSDDLNLERS